MDTGTNTCLSLSRTLIHKVRDRQRQIPVCPCPNVNKSTFYKLKKACEITSGQGQGQPYTTYR